MESKTIYNSISINGIAATLAEALNIPAPEHAHPPIKSILQMIEDGCGQKNVDRIFIFNPDAIAMWLYQKYTTFFEPVIRHTRMAIPMSAVMPSVTPVCFGTMYTGAMPQVHGIMKYEKPVIKIDTLFDAIIRAGKKPAIVAYQNFSMAKIFRERNMDYYIMENVNQVTEKALELIEKDEYDALFVYHGDYDQATHATGPESEESINALLYDINAFDKFAVTIKNKWKNHNTLIGFATDHGNHLEDNGKGTHGTDMPEDMNIMHFYGVVPKADR
jgi:predicted AlkP superfamily pyrophosphatase or phosphodiesterase